MQTPFEQWMDFSEAYTKPMQHMSRISSNVMERVGKLQSHTLEDYLNTNMEQMRVFGECRDPSEFLQRETELFASTLDRMRKRSEEAMQVFAGAQEGWGELLREEMQPPFETKPKGTPETKAAPEGGKPGSGGKKAA